MFTERRIFQAKVGEAAAVVALLKDFDSKSSSMGMPAGRIYTDHLSGSTDRVVWVHDIESIGQYESTMAASMQDASQAKQFEEWFGQLKSHITGAKVEFWRREN